MSAPSIPNLLSLKGSRGGRAGFRGRGRGGDNGPGSRSDAAIQGTDTDAAVSRMSAVDLGYLNDGFAQHFVSRLDGPPTRRLPIINRGTYTRTMALDRLVDNFLSEGNSQGPQSLQKQIISLGAGTDTRPFRIFSRGGGLNNLIYHELDFAVTSRAKFQIVGRTPTLANILTDISIKDDGSWTATPCNGGQYYSHAVDLRDLEKTILTPLPGLRTDIPTLILSECCLCYLQKEESDRVVQYFTSRIPAVALILYEPMHLNDAFGSTMVANLAARHILMPGLETYRNAHDQVTRLKQSSFNPVRYMTIDNVWEEWTSQQEKERVHLLEGLDEVEEWKLLAGHYIVAWGIRGEEGFDLLSKIEGKY